MKAYLVGGGLASLAAAAYLVRDARVPGSDIHIYERNEHVGGSLIVSGGPDAGYVYPGGRVFEKHYRCTLDLFSFIPSRDDPKKSIKDDILDFNAHYGWNNKSRLVDKDGKIVPQGPMGLRVRDRIDLLRVLLTPEHKLDGTEIRDCVSPRFFDSPFWYIWSSIMAFRPRHSAIEMRRYMLRFMHIVPELWSMTFIYRTRFNQYQAIVEPLKNWLDGRGVNIHTNSPVSDVEFDEDGLQFTARTLRLTQDGKDVAVEVGPEDFVFVTNGSQLSDISIGSMAAPPRPRHGPESTSWELWRTLARRRRDFGNPSTFADHVEDSTWVSFTVTDRGSPFARLMEDFTGREAGRGGLVTFKGSSWLITLARFHQPNSIDQPADIFLWWGYGIYPEKPGNFVKKPMLECSGAEILREVLCHLKFDEHAEAILNSSTCIPCLMPFAGSVCLRRGTTDRPRVVPRGSTNLAFIGQFCEMPRDVVFTMEYSVRSARMAVQGLLHTGREPPAIHRGYCDPRVLYRAFRAFNR